MLHRASLIVVAAVTRLRRLLSSALSWSPRRLLSFGRRAGGGGAESEPHVLGASDADEGYGLERWDKEFYRDPLDAPQARLVALGACSQESRHSTSVVFRNAVADPPARCRVFWLDYQGKPVRYKTLDPGETHRQQTFETHPWTFTTVPTRGSLGEPKQRLVVDGSPVFFPRRPISGDERAEAVAEVRRPSLRRWTHESHILYPAFFKKVSQTFLLTHARIRREPPSSPPAPRRSRRLLEKRLLEASRDGDVGPASAEDDANAMFEFHDRSSCDSVGEMFPEEPEPAPPTTTLGDLPPELAAYIVSLAAPRVPLYRAVEDAVLEANARGAADAELAIGAGDDQGEH